jgi:AraC family transcriptional regulator
VRERLRSSEPLQPLELQFLASGVYIETMRRLNAEADARRATLSDDEFERLCDYIDEKLDGKITCAGLARAVNLPLRTVFDGVKSRTGRSPYNLVIEKRVERARAMLSESDASIAEIACACGFSSQQHMTAVLSRKLGRTPRRFRDGR